MKALGADASFTTSQMLSSERGIRQRYHIAHAKIAIQFVERGCAKSAINRGVQSDSISKAVHQRDTRAEGRFSAFGKCGSGWCAGGQRSPILVASIVVP